MCVFSVHYIISTCFIISVLFAICEEATNWKQHFHKNSTRYRRDPENCSTCDGDYGFEFGIYSKCQEKNSQVQNKCPSSHSDIIEIDCGITMFKCSSGQCIDVDAVCDGNPNCSDNSDETEQQCLKLNCINSFRCNYGACVNKNAKCNGIKDCFDGSDEELCSDSVQINKPGLEKPVISLSPTPSTGSCIVPQSPSNGRFINSNNPMYALKPGDYLPPYNALITACDSGYKTTPPYATHSVCLNGKWSPQPLGCALACLPANSTLTTRISCMHGKVLLDGCSNPVEGTIATISCDPLYEGQSGNPTRICRDGSWDYPMYECFPICGQKIPKGITNVIGGSNAPLGSYPWHAGIYTNNELKKHLCGATILNRRVLLSAAHCISDNEGNLLPKENYLIAAGKYFRVYNDPRDEKAQYAIIHSIHVPDRYKGAVANYAADVAVIVLKNPLKITLTVQPVCVDWVTDFEYQQLSENAFGVVVGWGYTKKGEAPSEELKELTVPYVSYDQCFEQIPIDFRRFLTYDKICAGFLYHGVAVCQGDSGGGLTFERKFNGRYYLRGIVSTSPRSEGSCDPDQYAAYTLISRHIEFIRELETLYRL